MGYYINPPEVSGLTKEMWLQKYGIASSLKHIINAVWGTWRDPNDNELIPVCLVDNGDFNAAAVCYCPGELMEFSYSGDQRPKRWYLVQSSLLIEVGAIPRWPL